MYATVPLTGSFPKWNWEVESCQLACLLVFRGKVAGLPPLFFFVTGMLELHWYPNNCYACHHIQSQQKLHRIHLIWQVTRYIQKKCIYIYMLDVYIYISGQIIIFHQPRFHWNFTGVPFPETFSYILGANRSCVRSLFFDQIYDTWRIIQFSK